jgi:hypothetical protein
MAHCNVCTACHACFVIASTFSVCECEVLTILKAIRIMEEEHGAKRLILLYNFSSEHVYILKECPLLSDHNQNWDVSTNFINTPIPTKYHENLFSTAQVVTYVVLSWRNVKQH